MLDRQIQIYGIDTGNFYSNTEVYLHQKHHKIKADNRYIANRNREIEKRLYEENIENKEEIKELQQEYRENKKIIDIKTEKIKQTKEKLLKILSNKVQSNIEQNGKHHIRELRENPVAKLNVISVFDGTLTRTLGVEPDTFTDDFMVIQVYFFDII